MWLLMGKEGHYPKHVQKLISKMSESSFFLKSTAFKLPSDEEYGRTLGDTIKNLNIFMTIYYKIKQKFFFKPTHSLTFPDNVLVFNRNKEGEKSNFFVLVKFSKKELEIIFTDPLGPSEGGLTLKPEDLLRIVSLKNFKSEEEMDKAIGEAISLIKEAASHKPENVYYAQMHGHWGCTRGKLLIDLLIDDGCTRESTIIANMLLWHTDFDATGHHNHFLRALYNDVSAVEEALGITKVPAIEVTMPLHLYENFAVERFVKELNSKREALGIPPYEKIKLPIMINGWYALSGVLKLLSKYKKIAERYNETPVGKVSSIFIPMPELNGPHIMLYASSPEIMDEIEKTFFSKRTSEYPPLAPTIEMEAFFKILRQKYGNKVSFMIAHPACSSALPAVGLLDRVAKEEISLEEAERIASEYAQGVACFNPSLSDDEEIKFSKDNPYKEAFLFILRDNSPISSENIKPTQNAMNLAWSKYINKKYGLVQCYDPDEHYYPPALKRKPSIPDIGYGRTVLKGSLNPSPSAFVDFMHSAKKGEKKMEAEVFWAPKTLKPKDSDPYVVPAIVPERSHKSFWQKLVKMVKHSVFVYGLRSGPILIRAMIESIIQERASLYSLQELSHAAFRPFRPFDFLQVFKLKKRKD
ncbi:MAG: hypothetical protein QW035_00470 [Candidatus Anstonellales archaeon]